MDNSNDDMSLEDIELVRKHKKFYLSLENGDRVPATEAQKHFVAVCNKMADIATPHELAWMRYKNKLSRDEGGHDIIKDTLVSNDKSPCTSSQQFIFFEPQSERKRIMELVRGGYQPYSRLELIMSKAISIGLTEDDKTEIRKKMYESRMSSASPENYIVVFSNTDGQ
ncbi:MAG: DUF413 domain-containing protein [Desulfobacter sp.]